MALSTVVAELPSMRIVAPVAAATSHRQRDHAIGGLAMAGVAVQVAMRAIEDKTRLDRVIECPEEPARRVVALCAVRIEPALVHIVLDMAIHTLLWRIEEGRCFVAVFTDHLVVPAE